MSAIGVTAFGHAGVGPAVPVRARSVGAARRGNAERQGSLRLTRRGRLAAWGAALAVAGLAAVLAPGLVEGATADPPAAPTAVEVHMVTAGDSMWQLAASVTPAGADVRDSIDAILRLNGLSTVDLQAGQQLLLPAAD